MIGIDNFLDELLNYFKNFNPKFARIPNDTRLDGYVISITQNLYIFIEGMCGTLEDISIFFDDSNPYDIMTENGIESFANEFDYCCSDNLLLELYDIDDDSNEHSLISLINNTIQQHLNKISSGDTL